MRVFQKPQGPPRRPRNARIGGGIERPGAPEPLDGRWDHRGGGAGDRRGRGRPDLTSAIFASFVVSDPSGAPGTQWRAFIDFGDRQNDELVIPVQNHGTFEFIDTHTYAQAGTYTRSRS